MNEIAYYLAQAASLDSVAAGDSITVDVDLVIAHDVTAPAAIKQFLSIGIGRVYDQNKVVLALDHIIPAASVDARKAHRLMHAFQNDFGVVLYGNSEGVLHQLVAEKHRLKRGSILVGADSHTCTAGAYGVLAFPVGSTEAAAVMATGKLDLDVPDVYELRLEGEMGQGVYAKDAILSIIGRFGANYFIDRAVVYTGKGLAGLSDADKMTISNMGIEMGAMISYFSAAEEEKGEVRERHVIDLSAIVPSVACPYSPANVRPVVDLAGMKISQVVIGSCTNGRIEDMQIAAGVLNGRKVHGNVALIVIPASAAIAGEMDRRGLSAILRDSGAMIANPGCGPCFGAHQGLLDRDDVALSTTNRNFHGRMGHPEANIYLVSPRVAAESAVAGELTLPGSINEL